MKKSWLLVAVMVGCLAGCSDDKKSDGCPDHASYDSGAGKCVCDEGFFESNDGSCIQCQANASYIKEAGACVCHDGYTEAVPGTCAAVQCPDNSTYSASSKKCECNAGFSLDSTGACVAGEDRCAAVVCNNGTTCDPATGTCECLAPKAICSSTGACVDDVNDQTQCPTCDITSCDEGQELDTEACKCVVSTCSACTVDTIEGNGACKEDTDCKSAEYESCYNGKCVNKACIGKSWKCGVQYCSITGVINSYENSCCSDADCDAENGESCNLETNECQLTSCEEPEGNIILNWSFENWYNSVPNNWSLYDNAFSQAASVQQTSDANTCVSAVKLINTSTKQARLEGDMTNVGDDYGVNYIASSSNGYNYHLDCTMYVKGTGHINFGYRAYDEAGKELVKETYASKNGLDVDYSTYTKIEFTKEKGSDISIPRTISSTNVTQIMPLIAFHGTSESGIMVDSLSCVTSPNVCTGVTCEEDWKVCDINLAQPGTNKYGYCGPKEGYCDIFKWTVTTGSGEEERTKDTCGSTIAKCNTTTHLCEVEEGACLSHKDCKDDAAPYCNYETHKCEAGNPCENAKCSEWMECTTASRGECVLKDGYCRNSSDCLKDKPLCNPNNHVCVGMDASYPVTKYSECPLDWYYTYLNCADEKVSSSCKKWVEDPQCPINIVPNGDFEVWDDCEVEECLSVDGKDYTAPYFWFGNYYGEADGCFQGVAEYHYTNELPVNMTARYTTAPHTGTSAFQIIYPYVYTVKAPKRFVSYGFTVPSGTYDCSYWVRGKGEVRFHWYGSRGDASKAMTPNNGEYKSYDTSDWVRESFEMRNAQSGVRLIFYVGNTDASKDHIQIDDVACTRRTFSNAE